MKTITKEELLQLYQEGVITDHELVCQLCDLGVDANELPEPWKRLVSEHQALIASGVPMRSFCIVA